MNDNKNKFYKLACRTLGYDQFLEDYKTFEAFKKKLSDYELSLVEWADNLAIETENIKIDTANLKVYSDNIQLLEGLLKDSQNPLTRMDEEEVRSLLQEQRYLLNDTQLDLVQYSVDIAWYKDATDKVNILLGYMYKIEPQMKVEEFMEANRGNKLIKQVSFI